MHYRGVFFPPLKIIFCCNTEVVPNSHGLFTVKVVRYQIPQLRFHIRDCLFKQNQFLSTRENACHAREYHLWFEPAPHYSICIMCITFNWSSAYQHIQILLRNQSNLIQIFCVFLRCFYVLVIKCYAIMINVFLFYCTVMHTVNFIRIIMYY
jgi:hypothetical protein